MAEMNEIQNGEFQTEQNGTTAIEEYQDWEVQDFVDSAQAKGLIDAFVYSFKQGGRTITGLTARAIEEICLLTKPRVSIIESKVEEVGDRIFAYATAQVVYFTPSTKETRPDGTIIETEAYEEKVNADGVRSEPIYLSNGNRDPHVEQKTLTKAERAARRQLISQAALIQAKEYLLKKQGGKPVDVPQGVVPPKTATPKNGQQRQAKPTAKAKKSTPSENAMQACFKAIGKQRQNLADLGVSTDDFWDALYKVLGVKSREEMTEKQWDNVTKSLNTVGYGEIVRDVLVKCGVNLAHLEPAPDPNE